MKKLLALLLVLALLTGCTAAPAAQLQSTTPSSSTTVTDPSNPDPSVTEPPASEPPATEPPASEPPATEPPATEPPVADPPVILLPVSGSLTVHFIDVGQADCALLECNGEYALIDGGRTTETAIVTDYLTAQGVDRLSLVVGTHPHEDHIGGLPGVLNQFKADTVWTSATPYYNGYINAFLLAARNNAQELVYPQVGDTFLLGGAVITMLGPVKTDYEDANDLSLVLMVTYGNTRFLFTGDMEQIAETDLLDSGAVVKADVLKVGHHGSYSSTSYHFLREVAPTYAVISVGSNNEYGHPHDSTVSKLKNADVIIYRTDKMYNIVATSDGTDISFSWDNAYAKPWKPAA